MDAQEEHPAEEVKHLQRCMNDLISMMALPALWSGGDPSQIARTLIDVLQRLLHLDLIYVQLNDPTGDAPIEMVKDAQTPAQVSDPREIGAELLRLLGDDSQKWPMRSTLPPWGQRVVDCAHAAGIAWRTRHARGGGRAIGLSRPDRRASLENGRQPCGYGAA